MSMHYPLIMVIGYDLVSYLLHHPSARCVTFKELFKCKSTNKTGDKDKISLIFSPYFCGLFRKSGFVRRYTIAQKDFGRPYADYRISGEKGFASRLNNSLDWWCKAHFFLRLCQGGAFTDFQRTFSFLLFLWAVSGKPCMTACPWMAQAVTHSRQTGKNDFIRPIWQVWPNI